MAILLLSEEYIRQNSTSSEAIDYRVYYPHIVACQDLYLDELLGIDFKNHLLTNYENQTLSPFESQLIIYIKQMLIKRVEASVTDFLTYRLRSKGVQTSNGSDSSTAQSENVARLYSLLNEYADKYRAYVCNYISKNKNEFPLYDGNCEGEDVECQIYLG